MAHEQGQIVGWQSHRAAVADLQRQLSDIPQGAPVRLAKKTSNLFRPREANSVPGLDVSRLHGVIEVDAQAQTADVQGMTTYEDLVDATLRFGLMPYVVPQLRTITLGGAVTGLGIESSSFRNGLPHESVLEMDILTGDAEILTATPDNEHADLFRAFPNSYGSLGYSVRLKIKLEPVQPFVHLRHLRFTDLAGLTAAMGTILDERTYDGESVDFLDGVVFSGEESYLVLGSWAAQAPYVSDYTGRQIYYRSLQQRTEDYLSVHDYIWRWDTDWFWCNRAFGLQRPAIRRLVPKRYLRSDVYGKVIRWENRHGFFAAVDARRGKLPRERVIQDVELPLGRTQEFVQWFLDNVPIEPIWLCPLAVRDADHGPQPWPLYPLQRGENYVNVGFWSTVEIAPGAADGDVNREIERIVHEFDGHKSLYSDAYYDEDAFWALYGGDTYHQVKKQYDPDGRLPDLYTKAVKRR
ncbi:FAD-binding oxidoreductase [Rudaeicoccus suwonensis]|uniref:Delta(24)-sterol reductase n=1 Tax=Rudaeicoccus suwonensis TaxID=657409 RepID=A0A561E985_9MICO|nr:FAD-binding oxidoreductase [Rudaeicoccus suwonensis]TWE12179.1 FAD/FMN-containing dehydrogenase [Rudaeicoccus suwonensis]